MVRSGVRGCLKGVIAEGGHVSFTCVNFSRGHSCVLSAVCELPLGTAGPRFIACLRWSTHGSPSLSSSLSPTAPDNIPARQAGGN